MASDDYIWQIRSSTKLLNGFSYDVTRDRVLPPHGAERDYYVVRHHRRAAGIVPIHNDGRILLVQQWRHPVEKLLWSIPAGGIDPGESPEAAASRELWEETGYRAARLEPLLAYHPNPGVSDQVYTVFVAHDLILEGKPDPAEIHAVEWFTVPQIRAMMHDGTLVDGMSLTSLLRYLL